MYHYTLTSRALVLLVISFSTIGQAYGKQISMPKSLLELQHSPSPYECAVLSAHVYGEDFQQGDPVVWIDPHTQQVHALHAWTVYKVLTENSEDLLSKAFQQLGLPYGYRGVIYLNAMKKQLVLAHRGTDLKNISAIKTDARSIAQNVIGGQERIIPLLLDEAITFAHQEKYLLAVTGHSLGGWLAQITAFIAKAQYPEAYIKAITFDSPGAQPMLEQINPRINPISLDQLDITNYLSSPNLINACNPHIGTVYRVVFEQFNPKQSTYTRQSHAMQTLIKAFDPSTGDAYQSLVVHSWPVVAKKSLDLTGQLITGDKLNAILALCQLLKRYSNQESLGEYSGFFKFAEQVNRYHPQPYTKTGKDAFDLTYKYHYNTTPFTPSQLHIRHFPAPAQQFLKKLEAGSKIHAQIAAQEQFLQALSWNQQTGWVHTLYEPDLRLVCDQLLSTVLAHPELAHTAGPHTLLHATQLLAPPAVSFFVGREKELKALRQCFQATQEYILAPPITGPGGIGKSQLALRVVEQQVEETQYDHVFWIPAESTQKLIDAYLHIAEDLGIYVDKKDLKQAVQTVRTYLKDQHCLYVFDDGRDIGMLRDFLPIAKGHVLVTSRNSTAVDWGTKLMQINPLSEQEALTLAQKFGFSQQKATQKALKPLLSKFPRYPLTLVQIFSTLEKQGLSPQEFLTAMQHYTVEKQDQTLLDLLLAQPHAQVGYPKSALYVFKTSLEQLGKEAQGQQALQLLSQLGYLDPKGIPVAWLLTWDQEDTSFLHRKAREILSLLEKYSLIQWDRSTQQVYIHAETQLMVRHFYPQPILTSLINRLVDYVGRASQAHHDEAEMHQNAVKWTSLLPHGRMLFERLVTPQYPQEAYVLTKYLARACSIGCLFKEEVSWAKKQLWIAQQRYSGQDHPDMAASLNDLGKSFRELGSWQEALAYYKQALAMRQRVYQGQDHHEIIESLINVPYILWQLGNYQKALKYNKQALEMSKRLYKGQDHPYIAWSLLDLGWALAELGNAHEALGYFKQALAIRQRLYPDQNHPLLAEALDDVGYILGQLGSHQQALAYKKQALEMRKCLYQGKDHPLFAWSLNNVGWSLGQLGNHQEALACLKQALAINKRLYPNQDHPWSIWYLNNIGSTLGEVGSHQEALAYHKQALVMSNRVYPDQDHPDIAMALNSVGYTLGQLGNAQEALKYHKQALAMFNQLYPDQDHPHTARVLYKMGRTLVRSDAYQEGLVSCQEALAMQKRIYKEQDHPWVGETFHSMGEALEGLGKLTEAVTHYTQALCMALRVYQKEHPHITQYLNNLIAILSKVEDQILIQQTKAEVVPLWNQWLGETHPLTQRLRDAGK